MLPTASEAKPLIEKPKEIFINIDNQGIHFLGNQEVELEQMQNLLASVDVSNPLGQTVVIQADKRCKWANVVAAINACHRAGIHDIRPTTSGEGG